MSAFSRNPLGIFRAEGSSLDYNDFAPRFYNFCRAAGFPENNMSLGAAFCPDQEQGRAMLILTKHFGAFPVELGNVSGILDLDNALLQVEPDDYSTDP